MVDVISPDDSTEPFILSVDDLYTKEMFESWANDEAELPPVVTSPNNSYSNVTFVTSIEDGNSVILRGSPFPSNQKYTN